MKVRDLKNLLQDIEKAYQREAEFVDNPPPIDDIELRIKGYAHMSGEFELESFSIWTEAYIGTGDVDVIQTDVYIQQGFL